MTNEQALLMNASALINKLVLCGEVPEFLKQESKQWLENYQTELDAQREKANPFYPNGRPKPNHPNGPKDVGGLMDATHVYGVRVGQRVYLKPGTGDPEWTEPTFFGVNRAEYDHTWEGASRWVTWLKERYDIDAEVAALSPARY